MERAFCKVTVHKSRGAANAEYIGRSMEEPACVRGGEPEEHKSSGRQLSFAELRQTAFTLISDDPEPDTDPVWTWNAPREITGDTDGNRDGFLGVDNFNTHQRPSGPGAQAEPKFSIEEKRERAVAYFSALSELEERRGGVTHFRLILTVGPEVTNRQLRLLVNAFLGENFPLAEALVAIHRDTAHAHAHVYVHSRQLNNERLQLGQRYFHLDESWMKVCAEQLRKPEIYEKHLELKDITLEWKERWQRALEANQPLPPKPDRWNDHHDTKLRLKPWDDLWCGRLRAQARVAAAKVEYLRSSKAGEAELEGAMREAEALRGLLESVAEKRLRQGRNEPKRRMPAEVITISETRELARYERALKRAAQEKEQQPEKVEVAREPVQAERRRRDLRREEVGLEPPLASNDDQPSRIEVGQGREAADNDLEGLRHRVLERERRAERSDESNAARLLDELKVGVESRKDAFSTVLPDEAAGKLVVDLELARARAVFLRSEERNFAALPHRWVSPESGMSLAGVEQQITERLWQKKDSKDLSALREQLQHELAVERQRLPQKRAEAEKEATALNAHVIQEMAARKALGMPPPQAHFKEEHLHELMHYAESSRDPQLVERIYRIEREQAIDTTRRARDPEIIRRLEEKYAGLKLTAEVGLHQDERALAWAQQHATAILLPARDKQGKDIAVSLEHYEPQKGLRGALTKLVEGQERREMRSRLEAVKETYLGHRGSEVNAQAVYHRALQAITIDCHELSRGYGYRTPAAPALPAEKIAEIRAYAVRQPEGIAKPWLKGCAQAQALLESWTAQPYRARESAEKTVLQSEGRGSVEKVEKELQEVRQRQERMQPLQSRVVIQKESPIRITRERNERTNRGGRGGR